MYPGERFNSITHLVGTVLAVVASAVAVTLASMRADARTITAVAIYGGMLIVLYLSSTLYHSFRRQSVKRIFHVFDHSAIYLLIAGTYTPFTLVTLHGPWGWSLFGIVWTLAIAGVAKDALFHGRLRAVSVGLYLMMGWLIVIAFAPLKRALPASGIAWLIAGGLVYTIGIAFFAMSKRVAYTHGVWHLFVIAGSFCHYIAVVRYVALASFYAS
jgi:hemolysin III